MKLHSVVGAILLLLLCSSKLYAGTEEKIYQTGYHLDSLRTNTLYLNIENLFFFKNNEYNGTLIKGYTLPGVWVNPKVSYQPLPTLKIEGGVYMLMYNGAYKYPNYAYQDISQWKGEQFQKGSHMLPYFRSQLRLGNFNFVLGNLYGGSNHGLMLPMYNPELNLTADPEAGFQILYDNPRFHLDTWINWQSFMFEMDTHQEAFVAGVSSELKFNSPQSTIHWYVPLQMVIQHRGGELDAAENEETFINAAIGLGVLWNISDYRLRKLKYEVSMLGYYRQKGDMWPFHKGKGFYTNVKAVFKHLALQTGAFTCDNFISLLGDPHFGCVSTKFQGGYYDKRPFTGFLIADYNHTYAKMYSFGLRGELYYQLSDKLMYDKPLEWNTDKNVGFSLGAYLSFNLDFLLKKYK